ncbi:MAG TPA: magnesium-translocating P-type ATPase [Candidatus Limnocylindrales bacterium]|nr:magnesium-translocating P-type ATPase [Candidatus Limnocylindrales bacterium]
MQDSATIAANDHATEGPASGLTAGEAEQRLKEFGANDPAPKHRRSSALELFLLFLNPLVIILLFAAVLSGFLGHLLDSGIIVGMVLIGIFINFYQTYRSERAIEDLQARVAPTASVLRDGQWQEIHRHDVVPGDVIRVSAGDLVPADARLLSARDLYVQQAALTGESLPCEKEAGGDAGSARPEARNMIFLGTSIVSGTGTAAVVNTGPRTAFGAIAERLALRPAETAFDQGLRRFGALIMRAVMFLVLFLIVVSIVLQHDPLESLLFAVALAVGLTPEFLPMITSVTLAKGAVVMARKKVMVKHLSAIQNFGSIDVLCSDKTGTLTSGKMALERSVDCFGEPWPRALELAYLNSKFETGIRSPLDAAILQQDCPGAENYAKCDEIPFDFERRRLSVVVELGGERTLISKGSPEGIFPLLQAYDSQGRTLPIDAAALERCRTTYEKLSREGFRMLGVAYARVPERERYSTADERSLTLAGFVTFADPPLPDVAEAIKALRRDGVEIKIITGDSDLVTRHICAEVGIDSSHVIRGEELDRMTDHALFHRAERTTVFARVSPAQKTRIIAALKHRGHVVGFMGDGINDAPSLHTADVGISVSTAVDVARDSADIILLEPGLRVLHEGIIEGRKAFGNVMKYLLMGTSSNFGNMLSMAGASLFLPFLPMLPTQILLNNFLYDMAQVTIPTDNVDHAYVRKPQRWNISMIRNFMLFIGPISSVYDFLTFWVLLRLLHAGEAEFHTGWFVESLATQTLVLFVIRTSRSPLRSHPSRALTATTLAIVFIGAVLPFTPVAADLGFTPLPAIYYAFLAVATATYLMLVEAAKRRLLTPKPMKSPGKGVVQTRLA